MAKHFFTSESVTEGHPDKVCDQISDAVLDAMIEQDPLSRVACESICTTGMALVMGEISTKADVDIPAVVRKTICDIGFNSTEYLRGPLHDRQAVPRHRHGRKRFFREEKR